MPVVLDVVKRARVQLTLLVLIVVVVIYNASQTPYFFDAQNFSTLASGSLELGLLALPMTLLMVAGEIDLSIASMTGLVAVVFAEICGTGAPLEVAILGALAAGVVLGLVNGAIVTRVGVSSLVATLGTLTLYRGLAAVIVTDQTLVKFPTSFVGWDIHYIAGTYVTGPQVLLVALFVAFALLLSRGTLGRVIYFIGSNPRSALFSGIRVARVKLGLFALSGAMAAVAAIMLTSRLQSVRNDTAVGLELPVITAVLLGGTKIEGGSGSMSSTALAVVLIALIRNGLALQNATDQVAAATIGGLLILSLILPAAGRRVLAARGSRSILRSKTS